MKLRCFAIAACVVPLLLASWAAAGSPPLVLILPEGSAGSLTRRLEAELTALGFAVRDEAYRGDDARDAAERVGAVAVIHVRRSDAALEVWVTDDNRTRSALREVVVATRDAERDSVMAVRAVELLRAAFLEIDVALPAPPESSTEAPGAEASSAPASAAPSAAGSAPPSVSASAESPRDAPPVRRTRAPMHAPVAATDEPRSFLHAGALGNVNTDGVSPDVHVEVGFSHRLGRDFSLAAWVATPGMFAGVSGAEGDASVEATLGAGEVGWVATHGEFELTLLLGAGAAHLVSHGTATAPYTGMDAASWLSFGDAGVGVAHALSRSVRLVLDARVGTTFSAAVIRFDDHQVATWGRPLLLQNLRIEVAVD